VAPLATVFVRIAPNMLAFPTEAAAGVAAARLGAAGMKQGEAFGRSFGSSASKLMVVGFGAGLGLLLAKSVKAAGDFEAAMVRLTTSAGETGTRVSGNLKIVSDGILAMAGPVGTTVEALGKAMYTVESGSFHGAEALKVLRAAAEGAKAENADLTKVTDATTTALVDYHLSADKSAEIVSKLVAATAAGKTTFEQLTGALHSVLPVASAAGISIDDILGSLASMTLHGISAEQATQNLADAIRHMQNPTSVQAKELALLGLTTNQLASDLKTKGLSGTLAEISERILKLMPPGTDQVILQLKTALNGLSPQVRELGQRLLDGSITFIQYRKAARDLTPIQAQQAMSFASLAGATHRLGDQQLTAAQAMQSYSGALAKATGDATGMNVALMLTGENSGNTATAIGMVSKATTEAGNHVAGWGVIQQTFNFKLAQMHATLGTVRIALGEALLPLMGRLTERITGILGPIGEWITGHTRATAAIAGTAAGLVAMATTVVVIVKLTEAFRALFAIMRIAAAAQWLWTAAVATFAVITSAANIQIALYLAWSKAVAIATKAWAIAQLILDAAFSPMGLIVIAVLALVAAVVYAYFHFDKFRKIVDTVGRALATAGKAVWAALVVAFHAVGDAAVWLYQHALKPAFDGIMVVVRLWWAGVQFYFRLLRAILMDYVVPAVMWLWKYAIKPAFEGIVLLAKAWWAGIKMYFAFVKGAIDVVGAVVMWLYHTIIHPYFTAMKFMIHAWWVVIQIVFAALKIYFEAVIAPVVLWLWHTIFGPAFKAIGDSIGFWWGVAKAIFSAFITYITAVIWPQFVAVWHGIQIIWSGVSDFFGTIWNHGIKPIFSELAFFVTETIPHAFSKSVDFIGKAWDRIKSVVATPISWVIDNVINRGIIDSINKVADFVGVKDRIPHVGNPFGGGGGGGGGGKPPSAMADGGLLSGPGGPRDDKIPIWASNGEYVIPAHVVRDLGVNYFDSLIGRRKPPHPGDGSSGIAIGRYADGGLVEAIINPAKWLGGKVDGLLGQIPGAGAIRGLGIGAARKLVTTLVSWVKNKLGFGAEGGDVGAAQNFLRAQDGKPYIWASAGPDGYDCSGIVSAVWNILHGRSPYSHTFSTSNEAGFFPKPGMGVFSAGWANPGEAGGGSVGHTAGWLAGLAFESTGSRGVHLGSSVTPLSSFAHLGHMASGGLVKVPRFDRGGTLRRGLNVVNNATGADEHMRNADLPTRLDDYTIARLAQALSARPVKVEISGPDLGLSVAGVAP